jgi:hypothetical protein
MRQEDIEGLPLFPDYTTETVEDNIYIFRSNVYIHKDTEEYLKVYLFPIESCYVAKTKTEKALVIKAHLKECLRFSKYLNVDTFDTTSLPLIASLDKKEDDFLQKLHFDYT